MSRKLEDIMQAFSQKNLKVSENVFSDIRSYLTAICGVEGFQIEMSDIKIDGNAIFCTATISIYGEEGTHTVSAVGAQPLKDGTRYISNSTRYVQCDALKNACLLLGAGGTAFELSMNEKKKGSGKKGNSGHNSTNAQSTKGNTQQNREKKSNYPEFMLETAGKVRDFRPKAGAQQVDVVDTATGEKLSLVFWADKIETLGSTFEAFKNKSAEGVVHLKCHAKDNRPNYAQLIFDEFVL